MLKRRHRYSQPRRAKFEVNATDQLIEDLNAFCAVCNVARSTFVHKILYIFLNVMVVLATCIEKSNGDPIKFSQEIDKLPESIKIDVLDWARGVGSQARVDKIATRFLDIIFEGETLH